MVNGQYLVIHEKIVKKLSIRFFSKMMSAIYERLISLISKTSNSQQVVLVMNSIPHILGNLKKKMTCEVRGKQLLKNNLKLIYKK